MNNEEILERLTRIERSLSIVHDSLNIIGTGGLILLGLILWRAW